MNKLRLIYTTKCNRNCEGCCNKDWDIENLLIVSDFSSYDEILITGGEPLLNVEQLVGSLRVMKAINKKAKIYVYTAISLPCTFLPVLKHVDGMTLSIHEKADIWSLRALQYVLNEQKAYLNKSMRLNITYDGEFGGIAEYWKVKKMPWQKNCPLPKDEVLMRLP